MDALAEIAETEVEATTAIVPYVDDIPADVELCGAAVVDRAALTAAFAIATRFVEKRNTIPILSNALLESVGDAIAITATDLDLAITIKVPAAVDSHFRMTAPAHLLESFLKKATKGEHVAMTTTPGAVYPKGQDGGHVEIEFERAKYRIQTLPVKDFPRLAVGALANSFTMPGAALFNMLDATMGAISTEETRYYLNGIYCHVIQRGNMHALTMVATDGHRLYRQEIEAADGALGMPGIILPRKTVDILHRLMKGKACPETVHVGVNANATKFVVSFGNIEIVSKLVDGTFPDYQRVIPTGNDIVMTVDRDELAEALQSAALVSSERGRAVKMLIERGRCRLAINNPDSGSAQADAACQWDADEFEIGLNARYLEEVLTEVGAGPVTMKFGRAHALKRDEFGMVAEPSQNADCGSPVCITGARDGWDAVLMPMRV